MQQNTGASSTERTHTLPQDTTLTVPEQELWAVEGLLKLIEHEAASLGLSIQAPTVSLSLTVEHWGDEALEQLQDILRTRHVIFEATAVG